MVTVFRQFKGTVVSLILTAVQYGFGIILSLLNLEAEAKESLKNIPKVQILYNCN